MFGPYDDMASNLIEISPDGLETLLKRAEQVKMLLLDVDGVLTPGTIVYTDNGKQILSFHAQDGMGMKLMMQAGIQVAVLSSRSSAALEKRLSELGIESSFLGVEDKLSMYKKLLEETGLKDEQVAYIGDDWVDLPILKKVGLAVAVSNAAKPVKDHAHYITRCPGGQGAVREVCDLILRLQGRWDELLKTYLES